MCILQESPFDSQTNITGHNLFVSAYHGFAQMGQERIPEPQPWEPFPIMTMEYVDAQKSEGNLRLWFRLTMSGCTRSRYRLHLKLQLTTPKEGSDQVMPQMHLTNHNQNPITMHSAPHYSPNPE